MINLILNYPKRVLIITMVLIAIFGTGVTKLSANFSPRLWPPENGKVIQNLNQFEKMFGSDETIVVTVLNKNGLFNKETLNTIHEITEALYLAPDVVKVNSISNFNWVESRIVEGEDEISISPLYTIEDLDSKNHLEKIKNNVANDPNLIGLYVSKDLTYTLIQAALKPHPEGNRDYSFLVKEAKKKVAKVSLPQDVEIDYSGIVTINHEYKEAAVGDLIYLLPLVNLFVFFVLFWFYRSAWIPLAPFTVVGLTIFVAFAFQGHLGIVFSNLSSVIPAILIGIGFADCIHILTSYGLYLKKEENSVALKKALVKNFNPTLLTTVTTSIGFLSLTLGDVRPIRDLGLSTAFGVWVAWLLTYFIFAPFLAIVKPKINLKEHSFINFFPLIKRFKYAVIATFIIGTVVCFNLALKNQVNNDPISYFADDSPISRVYRLFTSKMEAGRVIYFVADAGESNGVKNPEFLNGLTKLKNWAMQTDHIKTVYTVEDLVKRVNKSLNNDLPNEYRIPDSQRAVSDVLLFYNMGLPNSDDMDSFLTTDGRYAKLTVMWDLEDTVAAKKASKEFIEKANEFGVKIYEGGLSPIYNSLNSMIVTTFSESMKWTIISIFILMLFYLRDLKLTILSMAPNLMPLIFGGGILYLKGDFIEIGSVTVCSICMGIAIDDTIHFLVNYSRNKKKYNNVDIAVKETLDHTGFALIITTIVLVISFGLFMFTDYVPNKNFGFYSSLILVAALITDLFFLPASLLATSKASYKQSANSSNS